MERKGIDETRTQLDEIKEALIGYAVIKGRLPCPASSTSHGVEDPSGGGACNHFYDGFVPAVTLGLSGTDSSGYLEDAWGNPIRYAVTSWSYTGTPSVSNVFTSTSGNGMSQVGMSNLSPNLIVCATASSNSSSCSGGDTLTSDAVAVIYSIGKNGSSGGTGSDEAENPNPNSSDNDRVFVSHTPSATSGNQFDDIMVWISPNVLVNRMVTAGKLP